MTQTVIIVAQDNGSRWIHRNIGFKYRGPQRVLHPIQTVEKSAQGIRDQETILKNGTPSASQRGRQRSEQLDCTREKVGDSTCQERRVRGLQ